MSSPFDILGIDPDADEAAVVEAYRRRVKESHPDHGGSASEFRAVKAAYEQIRDGYDGEDDGRSLDGEGRDEPGAERAAGQRGGADRTYRQGRRARRGEPERENDTRVEYLNYEVVDERGWALGDDDLFEKASNADLDPDDYGRFLVEPHESLLEAAENRGFAWPYACRGGACANCAVWLQSGELSMPVDHILPPGMMDRGIRLSCNGMPVTDELQVVYNVKNLPGLDDLQLPPHPFARAQSDD
ncbi:MAG: ferredoxin Fer [Haloarculaceae archaeon]